MVTSVIEHLSHNQFLKEAYFLVRSKEMCQKKSGGSYVRFILGDGARTIKAVMWENLGQVTEDIQPGKVVKIQGTVTVYQNELQLTIVRIRLATEAEAPVSDYLPRTTQDPTVMMQAIDEFIAGLKQPFFHDLLTSIFHDERVRAAFQEAPAAKKLHHNMVGGLLEHTLGVTRICQTLSELYPALDRELLISAALLHDIGKIEELDAQSFDYTDPGRLLGHLFIGAEMITTHAAALQTNDEHLRLELLHAVLAHHGSQEWGSPIVPMTIEAMTLHYADNIDAKIVSFESWLQENPDQERSNWSRFWPVMQRHVFSRSLKDKPVKPEDGPVQTEEET